MGAVLLSVLSVGDLAAQGGETSPFLSLPLVISCEGPQRLNDPSSSPSPASDLVLEPPTLCASRALQPSQLPLRREGLAVVAALSTSAQGWSA